MIRMGQQAYRAFKGTGGADVFAETRYRYVVRKTVPERNYSDKYQKQNIFEPGQYSCHPTFSDFISGYFIQ